MTRTRDAGLALGLLAAVLVLAIGIEATLRPTWLLGGVAGTVVLEGLAYRRPTFVQEQFDRRSVLVGSLLLAVAGIVAGPVLAPDATLSLAVGALGSYLFLLGLVAATSWDPSATA